MTILSPEGISNIILHVVLISAFIGIFFFTYGSKIESNVVKSQVDQIVSDAIGDANSALTPDIVESIRPYLDKYEASTVASMKDEDEKAAKSNAALKKKAIMILSGLVLAGLIIVGIIWWKYRGTSSDFSLKHLLIINAVVLVAVAITEFSFLTFIAQHYRTADINKVKKNIIDGIQTYISS